jgi:Cu+-exporting ATPase
VSPKEAVCAVCGVREKAGPEPVAATYVYQGKTYYFCKQACKEEFRLDPEKWIKAAADSPPPATGPKQPARPGAAAVPT